MVSGTSRTLSEDGSADAVRRIQVGSANARALPKAATRFTGEEPPALRGEIGLIALERRSGKAANDSRLLEEATGEFCLLLNEDSELRLRGRRGPVPSAEAVHHDQMAQDAPGSERRIVEYHRNRDRYLRKHSGSAAAFVQRPLLAWPYVVRALAALVLPGHSPRRYRLHARQALMPGRGDGIREAAEAFNRRIGSTA